MDARQFLAEFGHIANAPGGVAQLRELVLQLAIQGKLVEQDFNDTPARTLLKEIEAEKKRLVTAGKIKQPKPLPPIKPKEIPYQLPQGWEWVRLPGCYFGIGNKSNQIQTKDYLENGQFPVIDQGNNFIVGYCDDQSKLLPIDNPVIVFGDHTKNIKFIDFKFVIGADGVKVLNPYIGISAKFLYRLIQSFDLTDRGYARHFKVLNEKLIPLAPLEEQSRIVAKVDELMALCDKLEAQQQARRKLQNNLRQSTLQSVASATSPHELQTTWTRLADNFGRLFHAPEDVVQLRDLILDLAVHGLLVDQSDADKPIAEWFATITGTKAVLAKQKLISKQTALADLSEDDSPFLLPKGWMFVRLGQITNKIGSGSTPRGGREVYVDEGIPFLRSQNIWNDGLHLDDVACITPAEHERMSGTAVLGNDVLLNITGASLGRCALVPSEFDVANVSQHVTIIRLTDPQVREYLHLCILSPYTQSMIWGRQVGMAREGLSKKVLEQFEIPLPPIAEQHRIVARAAELMRFCDLLEQQLQRSKAVAQRLAVASVASITGIAIEQEEEPMKAPQTELIASLRLGTAPDIKAQAPLTTILARYSGEMSAKDLWQRFGGEIDAFYAQLKVEVAHGWILEPAVAEMREKQVDAVSA